MSKIGRLQSEYARRGYSLSQVTKGPNRGSFIVSKDGELADGWMRFWQLARVEDVEGAIKCYERGRVEMAATGAGEGGGV